MKGKLKETLDAARVVSKIWSIRPGRTVEGNNTLPYLRSIALAMLLGRKISGRLILRHPGTGQDHVILDIRDSEMGDQQN